MTSPTPVTTSSSPSTKPSVTGWFKQFKKSQPEDEDEITNNGIPESLRDKEKEKDNENFFSDSQTQPNLSLSVPSQQHQQSSPSKQPVIVAPKSPEPSATSSSTPKQSSSKSTATNVATMIPPEFRESPIFGVPLRISVQYAHVSISLSDPDTDEHFVYGHIPVVVAKCGVYLKKSATDVEGIFRLSGSARRIKELQQAFNTPPRFGKGLDWEGYNVHDAANVLRRYLNHLPEPIVPLQFYERFRGPLREKPSVLDYLKETGGDQTHGQAQPQVQSSEGDTNGSGESSTKNRTSSPPGKISSSGVSVDSALGKDIEHAVQRYKILISELPPLNRQLLMYILDLLSIFAARCEKNLMPAANLAAIFQPSLLSHPHHDMAPAEYHLSRAAVEFLIQHSSQFLSHIENVALKDYQERKKNGVSSSSADFLKASTALQPDHHLSPFPSIAEASKSGGRPHSKSISLANGSKPVARPSILRSTTGESANESRLGTFDNNSASSLLNSLRRTVSMNKRPSRRRSMSNSSAASSQRAQSPGPGYPSSSIAGPGGQLSNPITIPEIVKGGEDSDGYEDSLGVNISGSARVSIDSRLPAPSPSQDNSHSIDEAMRYLATSPPLSTADHSIYKHSQANDSGASLSRSSVADNEEDENDESDVDFSRVGRKDDSLADTSMSPRQNVSKWRRSLMKFNLGNPNGSSSSIGGVGTAAGAASGSGGGHTSDYSAEELLSPPTLSSSARSHSPHRWFRRMKSHDKKVPHSSSANFQQQSQGLAPSQSQHPFSDGDISEAEPL